MSLQSLLNQTIVIYNKSGYGADGREVVSGGTSVKSRFQAVSKRRLLPNGSLQLIEGIAFIPAGTTVATDDKVTYDGNTYKIFAVNKVVKGNGSVHHIELELTKWQT